MGYWKIGIFRGGLFKFCGINVVWFFFFLKIGVILLIKRDIYECWNGFWNRMWELLVKIMLIIWKIDKLIKNNLYVCISEL